MSAPQPDLPALELALEGEKRSLEEYLGFAWQTKDAAGKNMFIRLAQDETHHVRLLEQQRKELLASGCMSPVDVPESLIEQIVPKLNNSALRIRGRKGLDQLSALRTALASENRAEEFYRERSAGSADTAAQAMYARLAAMEHAHVQLIRAEIDNIEKTGYWFGTREFTLETPG